ncbi:hypothetical protein DL771_007226 [Monosporascus sp. 5C6A]|nr:hypothetical protein DL771_007226 [Monosporascus sp. 5C6A]
MEAETADKRRNDSTDSSSSSIPVTDPFSWLCRNARGPTYVSYSDFSDRPACSFDFGQGGFAASCNYGGELLMMTAPSAQHGILFALGDFEYSLYLSLARGQRERGGKSTFGLKVASSSNFDANTTGPRFLLGSVVERGCYNYRWPFNEYSLHVDRPVVEPIVRAGINTGNTDSQGGKTRKREQIEVGTCAMVSFMMDGVLYQVLRLDYQCQPGARSCEKVPDGTELTLTMDGPMRAQSFPNLNQPNNSMTTDVVSIGSLHPKYINAASFSGENGMVYWQATLSEFDVGSRDYKEIQLEISHEKKDHCSKHSGKNFPLCTARLRPNVTSGPHIFVATFRICEDNAAPPITARNLLYVDIFKSMVIGPQNELATGAMWQSIFYKRQEGTEFFSELCEVNIVARCLEKILDVDLVPTACHTVEWASRPLALVSNLFLEANVDLKALFWKTSFLIKVDRFLTEMIRRSGHQIGDFQVQEEYDKTLPSLEKERSVHLEGADQDFLITKLATVQRIRHAIGNIMAYLVIALLDHGNKKSILMPGDSVLAGSNRYYVMVTIWYVVKQYPKVKWGWRDKMAANDGPWGRGIFSDDKRFPPGRLNPLPSDRSARANTKDKDSLLEWFHHESILSLQTEAQHRPIIPSAWKTDRSKVQQLRVDVRKALAERICSGRPYRADDEIVDRLAFLAEELWPKLQDTRAITRRVTKRIEDREFTRTIDPCQLSPGEEGYTGGPWEVHALCHHSRLVIACKKMCGSYAAAREKIEEEVEHFRKKFRPFLTADASLTPCWERSDSEARRGFLRSEATAVLASTILDIFQNDLDYLEYIRVQSRLYRSPRPLSASDTGGGGKRIESDDAETQSRGSDTSAARGCSGNNKIYFRDPMGRLVFTREQVTAEDLLVLQLDTLERLASARGLEPHMDYLRFEPPRIYHPEEFFNSLDDTPHLYKKPHIEDFPVPAGIRRVLSQRRFHKKDIEQLPEEMRLVLSKGPFQREALQQLIGAIRRAMPEGTFDNKNIQHLPEDMRQVLSNRPFQPEDLQQLIDATRHAIPEGMFYEEDIQYLPEDMRQVLSRRRFEQRVLQRLVDATRRALPEGNCRDEDIQSLPEEIRPVLSMAPLRHEDLRRLVRVTRRVLSEDIDVEILRDMKKKDTLESLAIIDLKTPDHPSPEPALIYGGEDVLSDSLVDQEVRHRLLLTSRKLPVELLRLFVYVLHREMVDGFENHTLQVSKFALQKNTSSVVVHITLTSWSLGKSEPSDNVNNMTDPESHCLSDEVIRLPKSLRVPFGKREGGGVYDAPPSMELKVSLIGISTNEFGDFSKCSVITDLIPKDEMEPLGGTVQGIWNSFIHQPQTGRFLVFCVILGLVCRQITRHYDDAIGEFVHKFKFDNLSASYLRDSAWLQGPEAEGQLQLSLWSLEALYKLKNTMALSIHAMEQAKERLHKAIEDVPGTRSEELEKIRLTHEETLEKSLAELTAVQTKLETRVELNSRYSTAPSSLPYLL